jgi:hypothetical protein
VCLVVCTKIWRKAIFLLGSFLKLCLVGVGRCWNVSQCRSEGCVSKEDRRVGRGDVFKEGRTRSVLVDAKRVLNKQASPSHYTSVTFSTTGHPSAMHDFKLSSYIHHRTEHSTASYRFFASVIILISTVKSESLHPSFGRISSSSAAGDMQADYGDPTSNPLRPWRHIA